MEVNTLWLIKVVCLCTTTAVYTHHRGNHLNPICNLKVVNILEYNSMVQVLVLCNITMFKPCNLGEVHLEFRINNLGALTISMATKDTISRCATIMLTTILCIELLLNIVINRKPSNSFHGMHLEHHHRVNLH